MTLCIILQNSWCSSLPTSLPQICGHTKHQHCHQVADGIAAVWMTFRQDELACGNKTTCLVPGATTAPRMLTKTKYWQSVFKERRQICCLLFYWHGLRKWCLETHLVLLIIYFLCDKEVIVSITIKAILQNPLHFTRATNWQFHGFVWQLHHIRLQNPAEGNEISPSHHRVTAPTQLRGL